MNNVSRFINAPPDAVYRACTNLASIVRWRVPESMSGKVDGSDGATYRVSLTYPDDRADTFEATFVERVPNERIVERIRFDAAGRAGEMTMTTSLRAVGDGTEVTVAYGNLPSGVRPEDNDEGTRQALAKLAEMAEVRANIDRRLADIERKFGVEIFHACRRGGAAEEILLCRAPVACVPVSARPSRRGANALSRTGRCRVAAGRSARGAGRIAARHAANERDVSGRPTADPRSLDRSHAG
jgi:uncharacterized protein YndB with AHSA1/START domain